jgi:hypothetical protein
MGAPGGARRTPSPRPPLRIVPQLQDPRGELRRIRRTGSDANHELFGDIEVRARGRDDLGDARHHRHRERTAHLASVWEAEIHRDVGRHQPGAEVVVGNIVVHGDAIADRMVGDHGADVGTRDAAPDEHRVHVGRQRGDGLDERREALGFVDVTGRDDDGARAPSLERRPPPPDAAR